MNDSDNLPKVANKPNELQEKIIEILTHKIGAKPYFAKEIAQEIEDELQDKIGYCPNCGTGVILQLEADAQIDKRMIEECCAEATKVLGVTLIPEDLDMGEFIDYLDKRDK